MRISKEGLEELKKRLENLILEKEETQKRLKIARSFGDLRENAAYTEARNTLTVIEDKIAELQKAILSAQIVNSTAKTNKVISFNSFVKVLNCDTDQKHEYKIVGAMESDLTKNLLSEDSLLANAMMGKLEGDSFEFETVDGDIRSYKILEVS